MAKKKTSTKTRTKGKPGRKPSANSKSAQVRGLLQSGMSAADIAKKVGCTVGLVYNVKSTSGMAKKRGPGRPRKNAGHVDLTNLDGLLAAVNNVEHGRAKMQTALERIQAVIADALA